MFLLPSNFFLSTKYFSAIQETFLYTFLLISLVMKLPGTEFGHIWNHSRKQQHQWIEGEHFKIYGVIDFFISHSGLIIY